MRKTNVAKRWKKILHLIGYVWAVATSIPLKRLNGICVSVTLGRFCARNVFLGWDILLML